MKILFNTHILSAGKHFKEIPFDVRIHGHKEVQIAKTIRAQTAKTFDRGNFRTEFSFSIGKRHASSTDAERHAFMHTASFIHLQGNLILELENKQNHRFVLENACIYDISSNFTANASFHHYRIHGSELKKL